MMKTGTTRRAATMEVTPKTNPPTNASAPNAMLNPPTPLPKPGARSMAAPRTMKPVDVPDHTISREALEARYEKAIKGGDFGERYYIIEEKSSREPIGWTSLDIHGWTRRAGWANLRSGGPRTDKYRAGVRTKGTR